jgi:transposase-like protein
VYQIRSHLYTTTKNEGIEVSATAFTSMKSSLVCRTIQINGKQHYLWRAVDQDGEVVDVFLQARRDGTSARRFFKRLLRSHGGEPRKILTNCAVMVSLIES